MNFDDSIKRMNICFQSKLQLQRLRNNTRKEQARRNDFNNTCEVQSGADTPGINTSCPDIQSGVDTPGINTPCPDIQSGADTPGINTPCPDIQSGVDTPGINTPCPDIQNGVDTPGINTPCPDIQNGVAPPPSVLLARFEKIDERCSENFVSKLGKSKYEISLFSLPFNEGLSGQKRSLMVGVEEKIMALLDADLIPFTASGGVIISDIVSALNVDNAEDYKVSAETVRLILRRHGWRSAKAPRGDSSVGKQLRVWYPPLNNFKG